MKSILPIFMFIEGGLGNQLFQAAFGLQLAQKFNRKVVFVSLTQGARMPRSCELDIFDISFKEPGHRFAQALTFVLKAFRKLKFDRAFSSLFLFDRDNQATIPAHAPLIVHGYWQYASSASFAATRFGSAARRRLSKAVEELNIDDSCIAVHIRRGDYASDPVTAKKHLVCTKEYYSRAIARALDARPNASIVIFSDDPAWVRKNMPLPYKKVRVLDPSPLGAWADMAAMSLCGSFVISNSTYSFWAAQMSASRSQVFVPELWFRGIETRSTGIIPNDWALVAVD